jgi:hypothetical protein
MIISELGRPDRQSANFTSSAVQFPFDERRAGPVILLKHEINV